MSGYETLSQAIRAAERRHEKTGNQVYIVLADEYDEGPRYHLASDADLDTWWQCEAPVYAVPA